MDTMPERVARCVICGEPMPPDEQMFKYHGYSGPCPKPPLPREPDPEWEARALAAEARLAEAEREAQRLRDILHRQTGWEDGESEWEKMVATLRAELDKARTDLRALAIDLRALLRGLSGDLFPVSRAILARLDREGT